ncbi:MAG: hypothetical protein SOX32_13145 [Candidatus Choladocola sp.]|nr:hypothetical protein [Candidatus Choladocola sp.]
MQAKELQQSFCNTEASAHTPEDLRFRSGSDWPGHKGKLLPFFKKNDWKNSFTVSGGLSCCTESASASDESDVHCPDCGCSGIQQRQIFSHRNLRNHNEK